MTVTDDVATISFVAAEICDTGRWSIIYLKVFPLSYEERAGVRTESVWALSPLHPDSPPQIFKVEGDTRFKLNIEK